MKVIDHQPTPIDTIRGNWCLWNVTIMMDSGEEKKGSMQGDGYGLWAPETFEEEE